MVDGYTANTVMAMLGTTLTDGDSALIDVIINILITLVSVNDCVRERT